MALTTWSTFAAAHPEELNKLPHAGLWVKGSGTNTWYALEVDPTTGAVPVSASFAGAAQDFGPSNVALRVAALLGNPSGVADFGPGASSAQTLRTILATDQTSIAVTQSGNWDIRNITGTVSLPTGASTAANQVTGNTSLASIDGKITTTVNGVKVDVQASVLPSGASTSANQTTANTSLASIDSKLNSLGQKASAASVPVVLASDQSAVPVSQSGLWDIQNITGSITLPTGASTSAQQTTGNTSLASIDGKLTTTGNGLKVDVQASVLPTGAATSANQTTANTSLASIDGKLNSLGQKASAGSVPVVIASDQSTLPVSAGTSNAAYQTFGSVTGSALTGTYASVITLANGAVIAHFFNSCNQSIVVSLDSGTTDSYLLEAYESFSLDLSTSGRKIANGNIVKAKHNGVTPTAGTLRVSVII